VGVPRIRKEKSLKMIKLLWSLLWDGFQLFLIGWLAALMVMGTLAAIGVVIKIAKQEWNK
jgi:hypothetical protein